MEEFDLGFKSVGMPRRKIPWYAPFVGWVCWLTIIAVTAAFVFIISMAIVNTVHAFPVEPPVETAVETLPHPSLGMILIYEDGARFAHAKKGAVEMVDRRDTELISPHPELMEVWVITIDGIWYTLVLEPSFYYEINSQTYLSMIGKSWSCGCE